MKTLVTKSENDSPSRKNLPPRVPVPTRPIAPISDNVLSLQRKPNCACGGGCPLCRGNFPLQSKLEVSQPGDTLEQEADRVAEQVLGMRQAEHPVQRQMDDDEEKLEELEEEDPESEEEDPDLDISDARGFDIQRKCAQCEGGEEREGMIQRQAEPDDQPGVPESEDEQETAVHAKRGPSGGSLPIASGTASRVQSLRGQGDPLTPSLRAYFQPRFGRDFGSVRIHTGATADKTSRALGALAYTFGSDIAFRTGAFSPESDEGKQLLAHELTHVIQQENAFGGLSGLVQRGKGKAAKTMVGWIVKVGERKLVKTAAIYSDKKLMKMLGKGYNVLVKRGSQQAKAIAKKVWGEDVIHHTGHIIRKTGKRGLSHFQPGRHLLGRAGEKGWHVFYSAAPILFFSEDVEATEVYEDKYPGKSVANYLTVTQYVGEESWLSNIDWINPLELLAIGGDIGRDWDRERTKELRGIVFTRVAADKTVQTYELDPEGQLVRVLLERPDGQQKSLTDEEYFAFIGADSGVPEGPLPQDGTLDPNYASVFDAEFRLYNSKAHTSWDQKTLSFFQPEADSRQLQKIGDFYVRQDFAIMYLYLFVHPRHRQVLGQPGFLIPKESILEYVASADKAAFLSEWLEGLEVQKNVFGRDLWKAK